MNESWGEWFDCEKEEVGCRVGIVVNVIFWVLIVGMILGVVRDVCCVLIFGFLCMYNLIFFLVGFGGYEGMFNVDVVFWICLSFI